MSKTGEQTVRVLDEAYKTIRSGAPGLSDQTCNVLAGIIARKVSIVYAQPHPSQQAGAEGAVADVISHAGDWRKAMTAMRDNAAIDPPDVDDRAYWQHQLNVLDRCLAALKPAGAK